MKYSVEKDIMRYPAGEETPRAPMVVNGIGFLFYRLGGGLYVWRTPNGQGEVGRKGGGGTLYAKVNGHIIENAYHKLTDAMRDVTHFLENEVTGYNVKAVNNGRR